MFEFARTAGWGTGDWVVDTGSYGFTHAQRLESAFGCRVLAVDLVDGGLRSARSDGPREGAVFGVQGDAQLLPVGSGSVAGVWSRDMVSCVDPERFLAECARVLKPGGAVVLYAACLTRLLAGAERERFLAALSLTGGAERAILEGAIAKAGLHVDGIAEVGAGWPEADLVSGGSRLTEDLLAIVRMQRAEEALVARFGRTWFETILAWRQWAPFMALGKLKVVVYLLRK
ncbi:MAG TPA: class I SAM-dependent methyltransferase [Actinomycetota bacterium]|nr:class I SAM-dependent methyltransferase [Actinomycetota bacterium]